MNLISIDPELNYEMATGQRGGQYRESAAGMSGRRFGAEILNLSPGFVRLAPR